MRINRESIDKGIEGYLRAFEELVSICPNIEISCNDSNGRVLLPRHLKACCAIQKLVPYANTCHVRRDSLMEYGRPKLVEENWTTWRSRFFWVEVAVVRECPCYEWEFARVGHPEYTDEDGRFYPASPSTPAHVRAIDSSVYLTSGEKCWGLKDWFKKSNEIAGFMDAAPASVREDYRKLYEQANTAVEEWQKSLSEVATLRIEQE